MINIRNDKRHTCNWLWMFILVFAFMEMLIYRQATRLETASLSTNRGLRPSVRGVQHAAPLAGVVSSSLQQQQQQQQQSPCEMLVQQRSNQLACSTIHMLWEAFDPPTNSSESATSRTLPNLIQRSNDEENDSEDKIVLATHLGVRKLETLLIQARWWGGPISAGMYITSPEEIDTFVKFIEDHEFTLRHTSFHIVLEKTSLPYPHNVLRQLAIDYLDGEFFVAADVDFIPTPECHKHLVALFARNPRVRQKLITKTVMVLAGFERHMPKPHKEVTEDLLPKTKAEVIEMVKTGKGNGFHMAGSAAGHGPTDFEKWLGNKTSDFYGITYKTIFEPYILGYKPGIPRYWQNFRGYGFNKFSWFFEINKDGYEFAVLRDFWVIHMNHPIPNLKKKNEMTDANRASWKKFKDYLSKHYAKKKEG